MDKTESWLRRNDPLYFISKDRKKLEYSYLTIRQLKRIKKEKETLTEW